MADLSGSAAIAADQEKTDVPTTGRKRGIQDMEGSLPPDPFDMASVPPVKRRTRFEDETDDATIGPAERAASTRAAAERQRLAELERQRVERLGVLDPRVVSVYVYLSNRLPTFKHDDVSAWLV